MKRRDKSLFSIVAAGFTVASANAALVAYFPLNDGAPGSAVTGADDIIDDPSHPITDATADSNGDTWITNTIAHPIFDLTPGSKTVLSTTEGNRLDAGFQGLDLTVGFTWSFWVNVNSSNISDTGADVVIGTRSGNATTSSTGAWHKVDLTSTSQWNGSMVYSTLADDTWHHIAYVGDLTGRKIYKDGVEIASDPTVEVSTNLNRPFEIGGSAQFSEDVTGLYSSVAVWDERLSEAQIIALANGAIVPEPSGAFMLCLGGLATLLRRRR